MRKTLVLALVVLMGVISSGCMQKRLISAIDSGYFEGSLAGHPGQYVVGTQFIFGVTPVDLSEELFRHAFIKYGYMKGDEIYLDEMVKGVKRGVAMKGYAKAIYLGEFAGEYNKHHTGFAYRAGKKRLQVIHQVGAIPNIDNIDLDEYRARKQQEELERQQIARERLQRARERRQREFEEVLNKNTIPIYTRYLSDNPRSEYRSRVLEKLANLLAQESHPVKRFNEFWRDYPDGRDHIPSKYSLYFVGPSQLKVIDVLGLLDDGISEYEVARRVEASEGRYLDSNKQLRDMGIPERVAQAMFVSNDRYTHNQNLAAIKREEEKLRQEQRRAERELKEREQEQERELERMREEMEEARRRAEEDSDATQEDWVSTAWKVANAFEAGAQQVMREKERSHRITMEHLREQNRIKRESEQQYEEQQREFKRKRKEMEQAQARNNSESQRKLRELQEKRRKLEAKKKKERTSYSSSSYVSGPSNSKKYISQKSSYANSNSGQNEKKTNGNILCADPDHWGASVGGYIADCKDDPNFDHEFYRHYQARWAKETADKARLQEIAKHNKKCNDARYEIRRSCEDAFKEGVQECESLPEHRGVFSTPKVDCENKHYGIRRRCGKSKSKYLTEMGCGGDGDGTPKRAIQQ